MTIGNICAALIILAFSAEVLGLQTVDQESGPIIEQAVAMPSVEASYFGGRWAFAEEGCEQPSNWTLIESGVDGGNFVSEDLIGTWRWDEGRLTLNLTDLAVDEETGEKGGRFQMDGPVTVMNQNEFTFAIDPDVYIMRRCLQQPAS